MTIALAGNPNSGKTSLFNVLTGANQTVGNWPGVTVEKKEGALKSDKSIKIADLPGIYSLSPYSLEEVITRNYLLQEKPDAIINIIDATNLERNLFLTTQLLELGIPTVVALNMIDVVRKRGEVIDIEFLSEKIGCPVVEISALKNEGIDNLVLTAIAAGNGNGAEPLHIFAGVTEHAIAHIEESLGSSIPENKKRFYAVKIFERDSKINDALSLSSSILSHIEGHIVEAEKEMDDDSESIITNERYTYISGIIKGCYKSKRHIAETTSDKIDKVVTNRFLAIPIFVAVIFVIYYIAVSTVGAVGTDWANDGLFGDGWHLFGIGAGAYEDAVGDYGDASNVVGGYIEAQGLDELAETLDSEAEDFDPLLASAALSAMLASVDSAYTFTYEVEDEETLEVMEEAATGEDVVEAVELLLSYNLEEPDPADYGIWVVGIPVIIEGGLDAIGCADWLKALLLDGIVAGVGAVLGFVPQMLVLFIMLALLEECGYMARVAFILDRVFRRFGLSGKSFIPILISTGCGIPGVMASRTIESEKDRRMTVMTATFMPCGAKLPVIALIAGAIFGGAWWVAPSAYFAGIAAIIISGIMLKKTKMFSGEPTPFVMELPSYHRPTSGSVFRSMWERSWSFIKKAGTVILATTIVIWFTSSFSWSLEMVDDYEGSILESIGSTLSWIFVPLGFGTSEATVATLLGLVAKENFVATFGILYGFGEVTENGVEFWGRLRAEYTALAAYAVLIFNLLCAPCFAAIGAIKREMNNGKWTWFSIAYQCGFGYCIALMVYQFGSLFMGNGNMIGTIAALIVLVAMLYQLFRPNRNAIRKAAAVA